MADGILSDSGEGWKRRCAVVGNSRWRPCVERVQWEDEEEGGRWHDTEEGNGRRGGGAALNLKEKENKSDCLKKLGLFGPKSLT